MRAAIVKHRERSSRARPGGADRGCALATRSAATGNSTRR